MADLAPKILLFILIIATYLLILEHTSQYLPKRKLFPAFATALLFVYLCGVGFVVLLYRSFDSNPMVLLWVLLIGVVLMAIYLVRLIALNWETTNKVMLGIFAVYMLGILFITVLDRIGIYNTSDIRMSPFRSFRYFISTGFIHMLGDFVRNFCLFIPLGVLVPVINKDKCRRLSYAALYGVIVSTAIEATQLFAKLGTCDIDDIIANTLGTIVGYVICDVVLKIAQNWKLSE